MYLKNNFYCLTNNYFIMFRDDRNDRYGPPTRTNYRLIVENLSSRVSWQVRNHLDVHFCYLITIIFRFV